jgi:hypothetical protein
MYKCAGIIPVPFDNFPESPEVLKSWVDEHKSELILFPAKKTSVKESLNKALDYLKTPGNVIPAYMGTVTYGPELDQTLYCSNPVLLITANITDDKHKHLFASNRYNKPAKLKDAGFNGFYKTSVQFIYPDDTFNSMRCWNLEDVPLEQLLQEHKQHLRDVKTMNSQLQQTTKEGRKEFSPIYFKAIPHCDTKGWGEIEDIFYMPAAGVHYMLHAQEIHKLYHETHATAAAYRFVNPEAPNPVTVAYRAVAQHMLAMANEYENTQMVDYLRKHFAKALSLPQEKEEEIYYVVYNHATKPVDVSVYNNLDDARQSPGSLVSIWEVVAPDANVAEQAMSSIKRDAAGMNGIHIGKAAQYMQDSKYASTVQISAECIISRGDYLHEDTESLYVNYKTLHAFDTQQKMYAALRHSIGLDPATLTPAQIQILKDIYVEPTEPETNVEAVLKDIQQQYHLIAEAMSLINFTERYRDVANHLLQTTEMTEDECITCAVQDAGDFLTTDPGVLEIQLDGLADYDVHIVLPEPKPERKGLFSFMKRKQRSETEEDKEAEEYEESDDGDVE